MRQDDEDFSRNSKLYRNQYIDSVKALYGNNIPPKINTKAKVKRKKRYGTESILQIKLVSWAKSEGLDIISIPNAGKRSYWQGQKEVAMGLTAGVSDLFLSHIVNGYGGFWIELKSPGKRPTAEQDEWLDKMRIKGYRADCFDNFDIARNAILEYLTPKG